MRAHHVLRAHHLPQPDGDLHEQQVARGVPQSVVHDLEAVEVEEQQPDLLPSGERGVEPGQQQAAVRQVGEGVVRGGVAEHRLGALALGDVLDLYDDPGRDASGTAEQGGRHMPPAQATIRAAQPHLEPDAGLGSAEAAQARDRAVPVQAVHDLLEARPEQRCGRFSDEQRQGAVDLQDGQLEVDERHADGGVLEGGRELQLGLPQPGAATHDDGPEQDRRRGEQDAQQQDLRIAHGVPGRVLLRPEDGDGAHRHDGGERPPGAVADRALEEHEDTEQRTCPWPVEEQRAVGRIEGDVEPGRPGAEHASPLRGRRPSHPARHGQRDEAEPDVEGGRQPQPRVGVTADEEDPGAGEADRRAQDGEDGFVPRLGESVHEPGERTSSGALHLRLS
jgi:hypothetical protein